jgi:hypothetical protein
MSVREKLERMCPHFSRMKVLFSEKANITPVVTVELGVPTSPAASSSSDDSLDTEEEKRSSIGDIWNGELTYVTAVKFQIASQALTADPSQEASLQTSSSQAQELFPGLSVVTTASSQPEHPSAALLPVASKKRPGSSS